LAGVVVAAAVILDPSRPIDGLADSKKLSARQRERLAVNIRECAVAWAIGQASVAEIDTLNILHAALLAMQRALHALEPCAHRALIDGNFTPKTPIPCIAVVGGDGSQPAISAASILAKVERDAKLVALDVAHPHYGFAAHKGYGTPRHLTALREYGPIAGVHRQSFAPVRQAQLAW
jgi:ribonuclease HII